jgi:hypothetical protein
MIHSKDTCFNLDSRCCKVIAIANILAVIMAACGKVRVQESHETNEHLRPSFRVLSRLLILPKTGAAGCDILVNYIQCSIMVFHTHVYWNSLSISS